MGGVGDAQGAHLGQEDAEEEPAHQHAGYGWVQEAQLVLVPTAGGPKQAEEAIDHPRQPDRRPGEGPLGALRANCEE